MDPQANQIPTFQYTAGTMDLGKSFSQGLEAGTALGQNIGKGVEAGFDVMARNQTANDMLTALNQAKILSDDQYKAIAGKSLGAKEQLTGMYANQWILDQANQRALSLEQGKGGIDYAVTHAKLLDIYNQGRAGNPAAIEQKKMYWQPPGQPVQNPQQPNPVVPQPAPPSTPSQIAAAEQQRGQYIGGTTVLGAPGATPSKKAPLVPGAKYGKNTDTGKMGWQLPSGQFVADQ